jgi:hypothetical protein
MASNATKFQEIYDYVNTFLGGGMVDVELDPIHYETALKKSFNKYRQRNENSVEESYIMLALAPDTNEYTLPSEVIEVRQAFRRNVGSRLGGLGGTGTGNPIFTQTIISTAGQQVFIVNYNLLAIARIEVTVNGGLINDYSTDSAQRRITLVTPLNAGDILGIKLFSSAENLGGSLFEPFNLAYTNTYLLAGSGVGGLATYDFFAQQQELIGRMFGGFIEFVWNTSTKKLTILQRPRSAEEIMLYCYNYRPDFELLNDYKANQWIKDYTLANCKYMLGEARSKFSTIVGPGGGTTLNGDTLKAEAQTEMEKLEKDLDMATVGGVGYGFLIG